MKYKNGILFFDEYEKISQNNDIVSFLLHLTDFSQNNEYRDNYLNDLLLDLSSMWFLYSMNELPQDKALQDRIFVVEVEGYTIKEKIRILIDFLFPRHLRTQKLEPTDIVISEDVAQHILNRTCAEKEKGIRTMERAVKDMIHKISFLVLHGNSITTSFAWKEQLSYPVKLTKNLVDVLLKDFSRHEKNNAAHMYI
jgi:ATP-dependent Lon protease